MRLAFITVKETEDHYVQRAPMSKEFARLWWRKRTVDCDKCFGWPGSGCSKCRGTGKIVIKAPPELKRVCFVKREGKDFYIYRSLPKKLGIAIPKAPIDYMPGNIRGLLSYQVKPLAAVTHAILTYNAAVDASDTGTGKTYVNLAVARELNLRPAIICELGGIAGWKRGLNHFGMKAEFIVNWDLAKGKNFGYVHRTQDEYDGSYMYRWHKKALQGCLLIFDEAHKGKNPASMNHAMWINSKGIPSISLSATIADKPAHLRGLLYLLDIIKDPEDFDTWLYQRGHFKNDHNELESLSDTADMKELNRILFPTYGCRVSCEDPEVKKQFPDGLYQTHLLDLGRLTEKHNALYADMVEKVAQYQRAGMSGQMLTADLRYRQATELLKVPALVDLTQAYIEQGLSVLIFVNFKETLFYLGRLLKTKSLVYGNQKNDGIDRDTVVAEFQSNKKSVICCMGGAGGVSVDLHDLHGNHRRVSLICPTYEAIKIIQISGRTRRAKSKTSPIMKLTYAAGTIEEKVALTVNSKIDNIKALNDGELMEPDLFNMGVSPSEISSNIDRFNQE